LPLAVLDLGKTVTHRPSEFVVSDPFITFWIHDDDEATPEEFGFAFPDFTEWTLDRTESGAQVEVMELDFPSFLPYNHLQLNWYPVGQAGGFSSETTAFLLTRSEEEQTAYLNSNGPYHLVPHFDFQFMLKPPAYVAGIVCSEGYPPCETDDEEEEARFLDGGPDSYYPASFFLDPTSSAPHIGTRHQKDANKKKSDFRKKGEMIFGSYDGEPLFWGPRVAVEHFERLKAEALVLDDEDAIVTETFSIEQPEDFIHDGFWPLSYSVAYHVRDSYYTVSFKTLARHRASGPLVPLPSASPASVTAPAAVLSLLLVVVAALC